MALTSVGVYEFNAKDLIGHGAFAVVYRGRQKSAPSNVVAIKAITKKNLAKSQNLLGKEIKILKELTVLHHDNLVALLDCKETPNHVYLVMEYCNGGDLADYLNTKGTLSEDTIRGFLRQLAGAMVAMNSKGIVHRDLKPQNILLAHSGKSRNPPPSEIVLKIADFGFARFLQDGVMAATLCGSPMYMAPEVIMSLQYDAKADLWSLGTIVFQCLTGKAPFQAQTPQALKQFYEKNARLAPRIPSGTSQLFTHLLVNLLKRDAKDRIDFDAFSNHPFLQVPKPAQEVGGDGGAKAMSVPGGEPGESMLPPSPAASQGLVRPRSPRLEAGGDKMETSESGVKPPRSPDSSSDTDHDTDFVLVPNSLAGDSSRNKNIGVSPLTARKIGSRPGSLPVIGKAHQTEPIPVPTQKAAYAAIQNSLIQKPGEEQRISVSAMSGVSSASGGSILEPLPEEDGGVCSGAAPAPSPALLRRPRCSSLSSPASSPRSPNKQFPPSTKSRKISVPVPSSSPAPPNIISMSPPNVQFSMGTPPVSARRHRTSSCSSSSSACGSSPPGQGWTVSPPQQATWTVSPKSSPLRHSKSGRFTPPGPSLPPILGSPNKPLSDYLDNLSRDNNNQPGGDPAGLRRASTTDLQVMTTKNTVVLNYSPMGGPGGPAGAGGQLFRQNSFSGVSRRSSGCFDKENQYPGPGCPLPPPDLSEETLLAPEHNEVLAKLRFISMLVDTIINVARSKAAPLAGLTETSRLPPSMENDGPLQRRLQQLLLYMRCLQLLSQTLEFARAELKSKRLKPSSSVKNTLATMNERFRHCLSMSKMLNAENILVESGIDPSDTSFTADKILYHYALDQCQSAALDELFNNPGECVQRYQAAHVILHALTFQTGSQEDKSTLVKYKDAVEKRLHILEEQGYVYAYDTISN